MKYLNYSKQILGGMLVFALALASCTKTKVSSPMGDAGQTLVKILNGGTPAGVNKRPIDFVPTPTRILAVELRRDIPNETELNKTMVVTVKDDLAAVTAANPAYIQLNPTWYTLAYGSGGSSKTGGQGGTFTFTFSPGEFSKEIYVIVPDATILNPSALYGLGFTILTADAGGIITQKSIVVEIGAKNAYDGIYSVESGNVQRYTAGVPEAPGGLNGSLAGNQDVILATVGAYTVQIPPPGAGSLQWAFGSNSGVAGVDGIQVTVNPATNLTTSLSLGNATFANWAGYVNKYDPVKKTFTLSWRWNPTGNTREYEIVLKYKGPR